MNNCLQNDVRDVNRAKKNPSVEGCKTMFGINTSIGLFL